MFSMHRNLNNTYPFVGTCTFLFILLLCSCTAIIIHKYDLVGCTLNKLEEFREFLQELYYIVTGEELKPLEQAKSSVAAMRL